MLFQIHQNRAISASFCPGKIVNADHPWSALRGHPLANEATKQSGAADGKLHLRGKTGARLAASDCCHAAQKV